MRLISKIFFFSVLTLMFACIPEKDIENEFDINPNAQKIINVHLIGDVVDENGNALANVEVTLHSPRGEQTVTTDNYGQFLFHNASVGGYSAYISAITAGKFDAFRRMDVIEGRTNYTRIKMVDRFVAGAIQSQTKGKVTMLNGAAVTLPANGIVYRNDGDSYTGEVQVEMNWINPVADDLFDRIVGDLSGIDLEGKTVSLGTFGMLQVELYSDAGEPLNLKSGSRANLEFPIPDKIKDEAPASIPLWAFDEEKGYWIEEEVATYSDGIYSGEVGHFSTWNCDFKGERITLTGKVVLDYDGIQVFAVPYAYVYVTTEGINLKGGALCDNGVFTFINFPANQEFTLTIKDACEEVIYEETFNGSATDIDLGEINISLTNSLMSQITAQLENCVGDLVQNGVVWIRNAEQQSSIVVTDGILDINFLTCESGEEFDLIIYDLDSLKESQPVSIILDGSLVDLGTITICDELERYLEVNLEGVIDTTYIAEVIAYMTPEMDIAIEYGELFREFQNSI